MSEKLNDIVSSIKTLNMIEVSELVSLLEKEFGVSWMAMQSSASTTKSGDDAEASAKSTFTVILTDVGAEKVKVIKALRTIKKELGLLEVKAATENLPYTVLTDAKKEDVDNAKKVLEEVGAKVEIK